MARRTPLAVKNLTHQASRTVVSLGGVMLAIVLMFMQLGFLGAVGDTATVVYRRMPMDLLIRSPDYVHLFEPDSIDESISYSISSLAGISEVVPIDTVLAPWQNPLNFETRAMAAIGIDPPRPAVVTDELLEKTRLLSSPEFVLVDRASRSEFGPAEEGKFGPADVGSNTEVNGRQVRVVGTFKMGTGLAAAGALITSREGFRRIAPGGHQGRVSMLLIRLQPQTSALELQSTIEARLRQLGFVNYQVLSADEAMWHERVRWYTETPIGLIFAMGVALAVVVGGVICYMVLAAEVIANLPEYATLKAMGYSNGFLGRTLLHQSLMLAIGAYIPAALLSLLLYAITSSLASIPIGMTVERLVLVGFLSAIMCMAAGVIAVRKLSKAEPASLF
jgi:putative ABC transport system permease protein